MSKLRASFREVHFRNPRKEPTIISEFYQLRRTAIKDVAAYLGFLVGFIGSAPFAWGLLAEQLDEGKFTRGLWYFFGIVTAAGIFAGIAGLGIGVAAGVLWEQVHRHRRHAKANKAERPVTPARTDTAASAAEAAVDEASSSEPPRLQLLSAGGTRSQSGGGRRPLARPAPGDHETKS